MKAAQDAEETAKSSLSIAKRLIKEHEGCELKPYKDTVGKLTIGYGRNLDDRGITIHEAELLLETDLRFALQDAEAIAGPCWFALSASRRAVIIDMVYNLGRSRLEGFKAMWAALRSEDYDLAAKEMLDSKWARQVGRRAVNLADRMRGNNPNPV